jgi:hypothetical protein
MRIITGKKNVNSVMSLRKEEQTKIDKKLLLCGEIMFIAAYGFLEEKHLVREFFTGRTYLRALWMCVP